ncbi:hypothetical protein PRO82_000389 [Candidatus Protochlamydia amoebophila]|nr:hypothetical protein [Candidatus Protochlamydia amoebophila]
MILRVAKSDKAFLAISLSTESANLDQEIFQTCIK